MLEHQFADPWWKRKIPLGQWTMLMRNVRLKTEINYSLLMFSALLSMFFVRGWRENISAFMSSPVDACPSARQRQRMGES